MKPARQEGMRELALGPLSPASVGLSGVGCEGAPAVPGSLLKAPCWWGSQEYRWGKGLLGRCDLLTQPGGGGEPCRRSALRLSERTTRGPPGREVERVFWAVGAATEEACGC